MVNLLLGELISVLDAPIDHVEPGTEEVEDAVKNRMVHGP
jgi:hypothetical protein